MRSLSGAQHGTKSEGKMKKQCCVRKTFAFKGQHFAVTNLPLLSQSSRCQWRCSMVASFSFSTSKAAVDPADSVCPVKWWGVYSYSSIFINILVSKPQKCARDKNTTQHICSTHDPSVRVFVCVRKDYCGGLLCTCRGLVHILVLSFPGFLD